MVQADFGQGTWTAALTNPSTGERLTLDPSGWEANANRVPNTLSAAALLLDPGYAQWLRREPIEWVNELVLARDGFEQWLGPITSVGEADDGRVLWSAEDRMVLAIQRRIWWHTFTRTATSHELFEVMLDTADYGDPLGLRRDPRPNGVYTTISPTAGDRLIRVLDQLGAVLDWTVVGDTIRYGDINVDTGLLMPDEAWGETRPPIEKDGLARLTHVIGVTSSGRVFYPSADPYDRPAGSRFLPDTIDLGDVSLSEAGRIVERLWKSRQLAAFIDPDATVQLREQFPLRFDEVVPGAVLSAAATGAGLQTGDVKFRVQEFEFEIANSADVEAAASFAEAPDIAVAAPVALVNGVIVPAGLVGKVVLPDDTRDLSVNSADDENDPPPRFPPDFPDFDEDDIEDLLPKKPEPVLRDAEAVFSQDGAVTADVSGRYVVNINGRIVRARISLGAEGSSPPSADILKNGTVIATLDLPLGFAPNPSRYYNLTLPVAFGDSLQVESTVAVGDAVDLTVQLHIQEFPPPKAPIGNEP